MTLPALAGATAPLVGADGFAPGAAVGVAGAAGVHAASSPGRMTTPPAAARRNDRRLTAAWSSVGIARLPLFRVDAFVHCPPAPVPLRRDELRLLAGRVA